MYESPIVYVIRGWFVNPMIQGYGESSDEETAKRTAAIEELAVYMWENYIEYA